MITVEKVVFHLADGGFFEIPIGLHVEKSLIDETIALIKDMWLEKDEQPIAEIVEAKTI